MKTARQEQADRITHENIARVQAALNAETNEGKRAGLEKLLAEQLDLLTRLDQDDVSDEAPRLMPLQSRQTRQKG